MHRHRQRAAAHRGGHCARPFESPGTAPRTSANFARQSRTALMVSSSRLALASELGDSRSEALNAGTSVAASARPISAKYPPKTTESMAPETTNPWSTGANGERQFWLLSGRDSSPGAPRCAWLSRSFGHLGETGVTDGGEPEAQPPAARPVVQTFPPARRAPGTLKNNRPNRAAVNTWAERVRGALQNIEATVRKSTPRYRLRIFPDLVARISMCASIGIADRVSVEPCQLISVARWPLESVDSLLESLYALSGSLVCFVCAEALSLEVFQAASRSALLCLSIGR